MYLGSRADWKPALKTAQRSVAAQEAPLAASFTPIKHLYDDGQAVVPAIFDAANNFRGCVPGINEILRRKGLLEGTWCLNENESLSPGQSVEIDRILQAYPHLTDTDFVTQHRDEWLRT